MRVLIAEDDAVSRRVLQTMLTKWGYDLVVTCDGEEALRELEREDAPRLAILDWMMPGRDGVDICRTLRGAADSRILYILLLTAKGSKQDIIEGLEAGADDYVLKPFDPAELRARVTVGSRVVQLQSELAARVGELEDAISQIKQLQGLIPICMYCKSVRDDGDYWHGLEQYIEARSGAEFSHGVCPACYEKTVEPILEARRRRSEQNRNGV